MANIEERVEGLIKKEIENLGYELYDVEYSKEGKDYYLRVFIDNPSGIDLNDCEKVSNLINPILDEADYINEMYFLEVSSPGVERILRKDKHLENAKDKEIEIKLFKPLENKKEISGILKDFNNNTICLQLDDKEIQIERKIISQMKLKYNWN